MRPKLYRHYDSKGRLLYVGISTSVLNRIMSHKSSSHWYDRIAKITIQNFKNMEELLLAERKAIKKEKPRFNLTHSEKFKFNKNSLLSTTELAVYLNIPRGRIQREIGLKRFLLIPESYKPCKWLKWKIDLHILKPEIEEYINRLRDD